jgi:hypothetical protein
LAKSAETFEDIDNAPDFNRPAECLDKVERVPAIRAGDKNCSISHQGVGQSPMIRTEDSVKLSSRELGFPTENEEESGHRALL